jgi:hypothetical protein
MILETVDKNGTEYDHITYDRTVSPIEVTTSTPSTAQEYVAYKFVLSRDTTTTSLIRVDNLYSGAVAYAINLAAQKKIEESTDFKAISPADFPPLFNTFEKYICSSRLVEHLENIPSTIYKENITPRNNKVFVVFGLFSLFLNRKYLF